MSRRFVKAPLTLEYEVYDKNSEEFEREFHTLAYNNDDAVGQWLKKAKARGETAESDPVLLTLMVELHRKLDALELYLKDEKPERLELENIVKIDAIGFEYFRVNKDVFVEGKTYYGRVDLPVYPRRDVAIIFQAVSANEADIVKIDDENEREWSGYLTAQERVLIRQMREKKERKR